VAGVAPVDESANLGSSDMASTKLGGRS
jgi:hypothetical protein